MKECDVDLVGGEKDEKATVQFEARNGKCFLAFTYRNKTIEASEIDYFKAFCTVRLQLETENLIPFCYGASLNVYPSGMCRDMGAGLSAYRMTKGKHVTHDDLVPIFDSGADATPSSVENQRKFFEEWFKEPKTT